MSHKRSILAVSALAVGGCAFAASEAAAKVLPEDSAQPGVVVPHDPPVSTRYEVIPTDDAGREAVQAGASALGGAGVALAAVWLNRRRQTPAV